MGTDGSVSVNVTECVCAMLSAMVSLFQVGPLLLAMCRCHSA